MWLEFATTVLVITALLLVPGYLIARAVGARRLWAACVSLSLTPGIYALLATLLTSVGISCSFANIFAPVAALSLAVFLLVQKLHPQVKTGTQHATVFTGATWLPALYVIIGIVLGIYLYLTPLGSPQAFIQEFDNTSHLNTLQAFIESGQWSLLNYSKYLAEFSAAANPFMGNPSFYPATWHIVGALTASIFPTTTPLLENALNFTFAFIVFPLSMLLLLDYLFPNSNRLLAFGSVTALSFVVFPLGMIIWGPLFPNMGAYAIFPAVLCCVLKAIDACFSRQGFIELFLLSLLGTISLALLQPNAIFFGIVCFFTYLAWKAFTHNSNNRMFAHKLGATATVLAVGILIWTAFFYAPFLHGVQSENWPAYLSKSIALKGMVGTALANFHAQPILSLFLALGIYVCLKHKAHSWLIATILIFYIMYFCDVATEGFIKHYLTGFWYTDHHRIAACISILAIPVITTGLSYAAQMAEKFLHSSTSKKILPTAPIAIVILFTAIAYAPSIDLGPLDIQTAFGAARTQTREYHQEDARAIYTETESQFVNKVREMLPHETLVLNSPEDGSVWAYGINDLHVYYRSTRTYSDVEDYSENHTLENETSWYVRNHIDEVATNKELQKHLTDLDCKYVLLLDAQESLKTKRHLFTYEENIWEKFQNIGDSTPGFETVLAEGDMRLYRIQDFSE